MKRAGTAGIALALSGCSSVLVTPAPKTTPHLATPPPLPVGLHVVLPLHGGKGSGAVGGFVADGPMQLRWTCVGGGSMTDIMSDSSGARGSAQGPCDGSAQVDTYMSECPGSTVTVTVEAAPTSSWYLDAISQTPDAAYYISCPGSR